eukprot:CAMPEP_0117426090 /NCGR_PEP_ID=MMETSP0758-20121206/6256_1 /TAXON_ID=63605 /ORGANISM="Percolomonas cosmopolitus, Strain AE-1 (ATCC 50343)" /LENGTH=106 /DNA_ID=CAMNT_0005211015 /DNA_START=378 /DNA_END=698 /DNA_ORIENTATION=+
MPANPRATLRRRSSALQAISDVYKLILDWKEVRSLSGYRVHKAEKVFMDDNPPAKGIMMASMDEVDEEEATYGDDEETSEGVEEEGETDSEDDSNEPTVLEFVADP